MPTLSLQEACERLPVVLTLNGLPVRDLSVLVVQGYGADIGLMSQAAWGYLEDCDWQEALEGAGSLLGERGEVRLAYARAFTRAAGRLAEAGRHAGPESDLGLWAAWLGFTMAETALFIRVATQAASES